MQPLRTVQLAPHTEVVINHAPGSALLGLFPEAGPGGNSSAVRLVDAVAERDSRLDGPAGADASFRVTRGVLRAVPATLPVAGGAGSEIRMAPGARPRPPFWKFFAGRHLGP